MRLAWLLPYAALFAAPHAVAADCALNKIASFDAKLSSGLIVIDTRIDDQPASAMLDTGSPANLINKMLADKLKLPTETVRGSMLDVAGKEMKHVVRAHSVDLGESKAKNTPFFVAGEADTEAFGFDAIFGANLLEAYDLEIDLAHGKVNMFLPDHCPGQVVYWTHEFVPIPIKLLDSGHIFIPVTVNGVATHALLDTGASRSHVDTQFARATLGIDPGAGGATPDGYAIGGSGTRVPAYNYQFDSFDIGGIEFRHAILSIDPNILNKLSNNEGRNVLGPGALDHEQTINAPMILGMAQLKNLRLYFSFHEKMLYVTSANAH